MEKIENNYSTNEQNKIYILGGKGVGKTSFFNLLFSKQFDENISPSDIGIKKSNLEKDNKIFTIKELTDDEKFSTTKIFQNELEGVISVFILFALNDRESFEYSKTLIEFIKHNLTNNKDLSIVLLGNKYDLGEIDKNNIQITKKEVHQYFNDVFASLYQEDYIKLLNGSESIDLTCEKVNDLLKKNNIDLNINSADITKDDDEFIKARRKDFIPTMVYDLCKIDEIIKEKLNDYELVAFLIYNKEGKVKYPTYLCVMQKSKYDDFFKINDNEVEATNNEQ